DYGAETIGRHLFRSAEKVTRGAIHDDVDLAKLFDRLRNSLLDRVRLTNVRDDRNRLATVLIDRISRRLQVVHLPAHKRDTRARLGERTRNSARDTRAAASNKRDTPFQNSISKDCFAHMCLRYEYRGRDPTLSRDGTDPITRTASSNRNFPSYNALPTMTLSNSASAPSCT